MVSVSTSRSRDGLETHFSNVSVSFRRNVGTSRTLGLEPQGLVYKWQFSHRKQTKLYFALIFSSITTVTQFLFKVHESSTLKFNHINSRCLTIRPRRRRLEAFTTDARIIQLTRRRVAFLRRRRRSSSTAIANRLISKLFRGDTPDLWHHGLMEKGVICTILARNT